MPVKTRKNNPPTTIQMRIRFSRKLSPDSNSRQRGDLVIVHSIESCVTLAWPLATDLSTSRQCSYSLRKWPHRERNPQPSYPRPELHLPREHAVSRTAEAGRQAACEAPPAHQDAGATTHRTDSKRSKEGSADLPNSRLRQSSAPPSAG